MTFLNPAVLIGLLAAGIPIVLHFLNLRKIKKIEFSTLYFLKELKKSKIKNLKIKQWLLLLLRVLTIVFLVFSFAKPAVETSGVAAIGERAAKTVVLVLDNSYSMSITRNGISNFGSAKKLAKEIMEAAKSEDEVYLILTAPPVVLNKNAALKRIGKLETSYEKGNMTAALTEALKILNKKQTLKKELFVFSDFQKNGFERRKKITEDIGFGMHAKFTLFPYEFGHAKNLAIEKLTLENGILFPGKTITTVASVKNTDSKFTVNKTISFFVNGARTAQTNITLPPKQKRKVKFKYAIRNGGINEIETVCEDDALAYDNKAYLNLNVKSKITVVVSAKNKTEAEFVTAALNDEVSRLNGTSFIASENLSESLLQKADVLFLIGAADIKTVESFLETGKTVILFPSGKREKDFTLFLNSLRLGKGSEILRPKVTLLLDKINLASPELNEIYDEQSDAEAKINSPSIEKYLKLFDAQACETIIAMENNLPFLCKKAYKKGTLYLFAVSPELSWSDFPIKPLFAPLLNRIAQFSAAGNIIAKELRAGEPYYAEPKKIISPALKIIAPDSKEYYLNVDYEKNARNVKFTSTQIPGFYYVYSENKLIDRFVVNVDVSESEEEFLDSRELLKIFGEKASIIQPENADVKQLTSENSGSELWRFFIVLTLIFALLEMFVARTTKKEFEEFTA